MPLAFWIILLSIVLVLGGISLGAYLVAARKLYSKDKEMVASSRAESSEHSPREKARNKPKRGIS